MFNKLKLFSSPLKSSEGKKIESSKEVNKDVGTSPLKKSQDDDTVITNFTEPYLEAYFDGELNAPDERKLEKVLGIRYVQHQMIKRGELRNIISRDGNLSIPAAHDLKQEKKRVWNEIEHELKLSLLNSKATKLDKNTSTVVSAKVGFDFSKGLIRAFSAGAVSLVIGLFFINNASFNHPEKREELAFRQEEVTQSINRDYVLNSSSEIREILKVARDESHSKSGARTYPLEKDIREFEAHNQFVANFDREELRDLGREILVRDHGEAGLITFVSNR